MLNASPNMLGLVLVSHSRKVSEATADLIRSTVSPELPLVAAGGTGDNHSEIGTDVLDIQSAIESVNREGTLGTLVLMDMGSAILSAEMALELMDPEQRARVRLCAAPLVEGGIAAAIQINSGSDLNQVLAAARESLAPKQEQLGESEEPPPPLTAPPPIQGTTEALETELQNPYGLHLRPAANLMKLLGPDAASVQIENLSSQRGPVTATSLVALARLQGKQGNRLRFSIGGPRANEIRLKLDHFLEELAQEGSEVLVETATSSSEVPVGIASGIAIGEIVFSNRLSAAGAVEATVGDLELEVHSLERLLAEAGAQADDRSRRLGGSLRPEQRALLDAQAMIFGDPELLHNAADRIRTAGIPAALAWQQTLLEVAEEQANAPDDYLRQRAADFREAATAVVQLAYPNTTDFSSLPNDSILVCEELSPTLIDQIRGTKIRGAIQLGGGALSHGAILARSLGLPTVGNARALETKLQQAKVAAIDGKTGEISLDPDQAALSQFTNAARESEEERARLLEIGRHPARTANEQVVLVGANAGNRRDVETAAENGADFIGLFRSEFLFQQLTAAPSEEEQLTLYTEALEPFADKPITVRLLDIGGDKPLVFLNPGEEANPFLGVRGIRLLLQNPAFFGSHLRAILRLAHRFTIHIMAPMISDATEVIELRAAVERAHQDLGKAGKEHAWPVSLGIMIETPAAALRFDQLAPLIDFGSLGTNDLTQYTLCAERGNPKLETYSDALHPAVLQLCQFVVHGGIAHKIPVSICGEIAGDLSAVPALLGIGLRRLSLAAASIGAVKAKVSEVSSQTASQVVTEALKSARSGTEIRRAFGEERNGESAKRRVGDKST
ncbi:MAG: phosphoenolpyruvate--protein phosphotransferase [Verrucomicrobia bacterium]|nr:phosphoenolpyruvate--protein phosphotransferase [Verrucomicrobiota bacterium]